LDAVSGKPGRNEEDMFWRGLIRKVEAVQSAIQTVCQRVSKLQEIFPSHKTIQNKEEARKRQLNEKTRVKRLHKAADFLSKGRKKRSSCASEQPQKAMAKYQPHSAPYS
jgi:hypothetical protein